MQTGPRGGLEAEINVIPMIDVLLVMLVIFMLIPRQRTLYEVNVPPPESRRPLHAGPQIVLEVAADGSYKINGAPVAGRELEARLAAVYRDRPVKLLFIRAAKERPYRDVIYVADVARRAGVQVIGYAP